MCFRAKVSFGKLEAPLELPLFILDEIGHITHNPLGLLAQMPTIANYFRGQVVSYHDHCEDG